MARSNTTVPMTVASTAASTAASRDSAPAT